MRVLYVGLLAGASLLAGSSTMTGWISDASCGAGNASSKAESRDCAERCIKDGAAAVFVSEADQKVYKISDKAKVLPHIKYKVKVSGEVKGDTLNITDIKKAD